MKKIEAITSNKLTSTILIVLVTIFIIISITSVIISTNRPKEDIVNSYSPITDSEALMVVKGVDVHNINTAAIKQVYTIYDYKNIKLPDITKKYFEKYINLTLSRTNNNHDLRPTFIHIKPETINHKSFYDYSFDFYIGGQDVYYHANAQNSTTPKISLKDI